MKAFSIGHDWNFAVLDYGDERAVSGACSRDSTSNDKGVGSRQECSGDSRVRERRGAWSGDEVGGITSHDVGCSPRRDDD